MRGTLLLLLLCTGLACTGETPSRPKPGEATTARKSKPDEAAIATKAPEKSAESLPFAAEIEGFERMDEASPIEPGRIVFVGSSSIRRWETLAQDMAPLRVLNRGFGGSAFSDAIRYADRIITKYEPSAVVVYEGDNDLAYDNGKTAESVAREVETFVRILRVSDPNEVIVLLAIKPSPARMGRWPEMRKANERIEAYCKATAGVEYIDVASHLFAKDGALRAEAFVEDGIHLSTLGYREWTDIIRPRLEAILRPSL